MFANSEGLVFEGKGGNFDGTRWIGGAALRTIVQQLEEISQKVGVAIDPLRSEAMAGQR
jgi:hypothetical protein